DQRQPHPGLADRERRLLQLPEDRRAVLRASGLELAEPHAGGFAPGPADAVPELLGLAPALRQRLGACLPRLRTHCDRVGHAAARTVRWAHCSSPLRPRLASAVACSMSWYTRSISVSRSLACR